MYYPTWNDVPELTPEEEQEVIAASDNQGYYFDYWGQVCVTAKSEKEAREKVEASIFRQPLGDGVFAVGIHGSSQNFILTNVTKETVQEVRASKRWSKYLGTLEMPYPPMPYGIPE